MKTGSFIVLSLLGVAAAQPHGHQRHRRRHVHHKRDYVTDTVTVMETAPAAVVYVDPNGNVLYTSGAASETPAVQAAAATSASEEQNAAPTSYSFPSFKTSSTTKPKKTRKKTTKTTPTPTPTPTPSTSSTPTTTEAPATTTALAGGEGGYIGSSAAATTSASSGSSDVSGYGIAYSPYNKDGTCRSASDVSSDFTKIKGFSYVRSYGVDCEQVPNMMKAAKDNGMKIMLGVFDLAALDDELNTMISAVGGDWSNVHSVSIGNEDVNQGKTDVGTVVSATNTGRSKLRSAGFDGPVVHVDTFNQVIDNPELCTNSDYAAANCHAFFDPNTAAKDAGTFVQTQVDNMKKVCGGKKVQITESGWPKGGNTNGLAVPDPSAQQTALDSIKSTFSSDIVFFSAYNDLWKQDNAGTYGAEHYWGMFDDGDELKGF